MNKLISGDDRVAVQFLNYKNKVEPDPYTPMEPNTLNEQLWPVEVSKNGKRIGLSYIAPKEEA